jgi:hypothetical protein
MSDWRKLVSEIYKPQTHTQNTQKSVVDRPVRTSEYFEYAKQNIDSGEKPASRASAIKPWDLIWWRSPRDGRTKGPAVVEGTLESDGALWCWLTYEGITHLLHSKLIVKIDKDEWPI